MDIYQSSDYSTQNEKWLGPKWSIGGIVGRDFVRFRIEWKRYYVGLRGRVEEECGTKLVSQGSSILSTWWY